MSILKLALALFVLSAPAWGTCTYPAVTCNQTVKTAGGDYPLTNAGLASAIADAATYQSTDAAHCVPYYINIDPQATAPTGITSVDQTLAVKTCAKHIYIQSAVISTVPIRPGGADATKLAKLTCTPAATGTLITAVATTANNAVQYYTLRGLEFTGYCLYYSILIGSSNLALDKEAPDLKPHHIVLDRIWAHNVCDANNNCNPAPIRQINIAGRSISVTNSRIEPTPFQPGTGDTQALSISDAFGVDIYNNELGSGTQGMFLDQRAVGVTIRGNHFFKDPKFKWSMGVATAPAGACYGPVGSGEGERYSNLAAFPTTNIFGEIVSDSTFSNNGSGAYRVTKAAHGYSTGQTVQVLFSFASPGIVAAWSIVVVDANTFDLVASTFWGAGGGNVTRILGAYECLGGSGLLGVSDGTWSPTPAKFGAYWNLKVGCVELKTGTGVVVWGNVCDNYWPGIIGVGQFQQAAAFMINQVETPVAAGCVPGNGVCNTYGVSNTEFHSNLVRNAVGGVWAGNISKEFSQGPIDIRVHDNVFSNMGKPFLNPFGSGGFQEIIFKSLAGDACNFNPLGNCTRGLWSTSFQITHNTALNQDSTNQTYQQYLMQNNTESMQNGVFDNNIVSPLNENIFAAPISGPNVATGLCGWSQSHNPVYPTGFGAGYSLRKNILAGVAQPTYAAPTQSNSLTTACATYNTYPTDHVFFNNTYTGKFTNVTSADPTAWDYTCLAGWTDCHNAGTDGKDIGACISCMNQATAGSITGAANLWYNLDLKPPTAITATTATVPYSAPTSGACTITVSANQDYSAPAFTATDSGGALRRSAAVTSLTTGTAYYMKLSCDSGTYVLDNSSRPLLARFITP